jgi:hypothetical protein
MKDDFSFFAMLASAGAVRVYDSVRITLRATLMLAGCPAMPGRG